MIRRNGDVLPTVLVDGRVVGVWRPIGDAIEVSAFERIDGAAWTGIGHEAGRLMALLSRDPTTYQRYGHWWDKGLPSTEVRRFGP